ncbi:hypothetical protein [Ralstonia pseudosolanacearum]|uniref:hypothetical protein n=1 Tax=Ralstonia pseudosolanacearum TaxID=1310165 RepID=UPI003CFB3B96
MKAAVYFLIEGGKALELVKQHIAEAKRVGEQVLSLAKDVGASQVFKSREDGTLLAVKFSGKVPPDFTKQTNRGSRPKRGTDWEKRFHEQEGYKNPSVAIGEAFKIPFGLKYGKGGGSGFRMLGLPLSECGFLYLSEEGPYAMWVPNVPAEVAEDEAKGFVVSEPAKSFRLEFDGCRRIEEEEWDILVAEHKLKQKKALAEYNADMATAA